MTYALFGTTLALTWLFLLNLALSVLVAAGAGWFANAMPLEPPAVRARALIALRLLPSVGSFAFVAAVFLPSFFRLEPRDFDETFGVVTTSCALLATVLIGRAAWRGGTSWLQAIRRVRALLRGATPLALRGAPLPVFVVNARQAAMTLVGVGRARLLITRPLLAALTAEELDAALKHEYSHFSSRDNLKRLAMLCAPDLLSIVGRHRELEDQWALAAEHAADQDAARESTRTGLALASALTKAARLTALPAPGGALTSPLIGMETITSRVARLVDRAPVRGRRRYAEAACWTLALLAVAVCIWGYAPMLEQAHDLTETLVQSLP